MNINKCLVLNLLKISSLSFLALGCNITQAVPVKEIVADIKTKQGLNYFKIMDAINEKLAPYLFFYETKEMDVDPGVAEFPPRFYKERLNPKVNKETTSIIKKIRMTALTLDMIRKKIGPAIREKFLGIAPLNELILGNFAKEDLVANVLPAIRGNINEQEREETVNILCERIKTMDGSARVLLANAARGFFARMEWIPTYDDPKDDSKKISSIKVLPSYPDATQYQQNLQEEDLKKLKKQLYHVDNQEEANRIIEALRAPAEFPSRFPEKIQEMLRKLPTGLIPEIRFRLLKNSEADYFEAPMTFSCQDEKIIQLYVGICKKLMREQNVPMEEIVTFLNSLNGENTQTENE